MYYDADNGEMDADAKLDPSSGEEMQKIVIKGGGGHKTSPDHVDAPLSDSQVAHKVRKSKIGALGPEEVS